jgi:uncharacterized membrane protein
MALLMGALWLMSGAVIALVGVAGVRGRLPRQHWAGIRLPSTMRSDEAWAAAHRAGGPWLVAGGVVPAVCGLGLLVARPADDVSTATSLAMAGWMLVLACVAGVIGVRAARNA